MLQQYASQTMKKKKAEAQSSTFLTGVGADGDFEESKDPLTYAATLNKRQKKLFNDVVKTGDQETAEDFQTAMSLLNNYQKDKEFFKKDVKKVKQDSAFVMQESAKDPVEELRKIKEKPVNKPKTIDPSLTMAERHRAVQEMREKRLAERNERMTTGNYA